jgi:hypothetical protein
MTLVRHGFLGEGTKDVPQQTCPRFFLDALEDVPKKDEIGVGEDKPEDVVETAFQVLGLVDKHPLDGMGEGLGEEVDDFRIGEVVLTDPGLDVLTATLVVGFVEIGTSNGEGNRVDKRIKSADHRSLFDSCGPKTTDELVLDTDVKGTHAHFFDRDDLIPPEIEKETEHKRRFSISKDALHHKFVMNLKIATIIINIINIITSNHFIKGVENFLLFVVPGKVLEPDEVIETFLCLGFGGKTGLAAEIGESGDKVFFCFLLFSYFFFFYRCRRCCHR